MKRLFLLLAVALPTCMYAQHFDFAYNAGVLAAKTSSYSNIAFKPDNKVGLGFTNALTAKYITRIGVFGGVSVGFSKLTDGTEIMVTTLEHPEGTAQKKHVIYGNPSVNVDVIGGYQIRIKRSAISADVKLGYVSNSVKSHSNTGDVYWPETKGIRWGGDFEYRYYFTKHLSAGIMLSPMVYSLHAESQPKSHFVIDAMATSAGIHYTL